jgi:hypothetical protein
VDVSEQNWTLGVLGPTELDVVTNVFRKIIAESWFAKDISTRHKFGAYIIHATKGVRPMSASSTQFAFSTRKRTMVQRPNLVNCGSRSLPSVGLRDRA